MIIGIVELSHARRERFAFEYPAGDTMAAFCVAKDTVVESVSLFTSSVGGVVYLTGLLDREVLSDGVRSDLMDTRFFARFYMSTIALTNFIASFFMLPIYVAMGIEKTVSCGLNNVIRLIQNIESAVKDNTVQIGSRQELPVNEQAVAVCASQSMAQRLRDIGQIGRH